MYVPLPKDSSLYVFYLYVFNIIKKVSTVLLSMIENLTQSNKDD